MSAANLTSIEVVSSFQGALHEFEAAARDALVQLTLEARRALDWIESDRTLYWPREVRKAADAVSEARLALDRCRIKVAADEHRVCYDEQKVLDAAKRRLALAEAKTVTVRQWRIELTKELEAFEVERAKLEHYLEFDFAKASAALSRMVAALDRYIDEAKPC